MCHGNDHSSISKEFRNLKEAGERFSEHETSDCHKECNRSLDMADDEVDVGEKMSDSLLNEKAKNLQRFLTIL